MSAIRKRYITRLVCRIVIFLLSLALFFYRPEELRILRGMNFWRRFSPLHLLWVVWIGDMLCQLLPIKESISLGSKKLFRGKFRPIREKINYEALRDYVKTTTKSAYRVMLLWAGLLAVLALLFYTDVITDAILFLVSVAFYVCDLICVLIWCPFRLLMSTRCCTTCRIFNWDHLMMFSPMVFIGGFFALSLFAISVIVFVVWELTVVLHPERFWEHSNIALRCSECTDKLCTQYCQKLRGGK